MRVFKYLSIIIALAGAALSSCDVHEFPYPVDKEIPFVLHLDYSTELPLHKIVEYYEDNTKSSGNADSYDIRYIVLVDTAGNTAASEYKYRFVFTEDEVSRLDNSVTMNILEGNYNFTVWTDYVQAGSENDHHYDTDKFEEIGFVSQEHIGCSDWKDAFNGSVASEVSKEVTEATVQMGRPMAKFNFISTDVEKFLSKADYGSINWDELKIVFTYNGFVPYSFNLFTNKPADAKTNVDFNAKVNLIGEGEAELGFDYVFVHENESHINVSVAIYNNTGELISKSKPLEVPLMRSKLTTVKADFLTSEADGGVTIVPDFDGEHNYEIK